MAGGTEAGGQAADATARPRPDFGVQLWAIGQSRQVQSNWYREQYPDVAALGMDPAQHYLRFGAIMGRNPGKGFDTRFYLEANPEVAGSGLNPLAHYVLQGCAEGRRPKPPPGDRLHEARRRIDGIRAKLLGLGFTEAPLDELREILRSEADPAPLRALAARELALWHMRQRTEADWRRALDHVAAARALETDLDFRSKLATAEILCHHFLGAAAEGRAAYERAALAGEVSPDTHLAWANFHEAPEARVAWINQVLGRTGIAPVALLPDDGRAPYDRLTAAEAPPKVAGGPKVSVLLAAYEAADTLPTALCSLQEQSWANLEIIVVDDCSPTPATAAVAERFAARDDRIRVIRLPRNAGAYVARNAGLDAATGEFVTLHDADDWSHPGKIETQVRFLQAHPAVMGCTSEQARARSDLGFTRWTGQCRFIIPNISSFLFRREPMRARFGYWDTVRYAADNELIRRMQARIGKKAVVAMATGPLSFQRDSDSSAVADDAVGMNGFYFGARRDYVCAYSRSHGAGRFRYGGDPSRRPFAAPRLVRERPHPDEPPRRFDVVIASDFRMRGGSVASCIQEIRACRAGGLAVGVVEMFRYDLGVGAGDMRAEVRAEIDGEQVQVLTFGERIRTDLLVIRYPPVLQHPQRHLPAIEAGDIRVVINQPPVSDYSETGIKRYDFASCVATLRHHFGRDATWHPNGPMVRAAIETHHAEDRACIALSAENWDNIIHLPDWQRPGYRPRPDGRLRIGRHARDASVKWPATVEELRAVYPGRPDVEVHVLGGAEVPRAMLGGLPANWTVHPFDAVPPRDFLAGLDAFVYFPHRDWVESFPRNVLEAMAVGVPVVLPETFRPLFGDRAAYATPGTALVVAEALCRDADACAAQIRRAHDHMRLRNSYDAHLRRIARIVDGRIARAPQPARVTTT